MLDKIAFEIIRRKSGDKLVSAQIHYACDHLISRDYAEREDIVKMVKRDAAMGIWNQMYGKLHRPLVDLRHLVRINIHPISSDTVAIDKQFEALGSLIKFPESLLG